MQIAIADTILKPNLTNPGCEEPAICISNGSASNWDTSRCCAKGKASDRR